MSFSLKNALFCIVTFLILISFVQCRKESFITDSSAKLEFSRDTIFFDTVFSTIGSTTQYLKVRNTHNEAIRISEIALETGSNSQYRINIDGLDGPVQQEIEILPNDSIFIFIEVTVDPGNQALPFILEDKIRFLTNGNTQYVVLQAWGQDAHFHGGLNSCGDPFSYIIPTGTTEVWNNDKPHVIYGIIAVDSLATLQINPGTRIYCHGKSGIFVYKGTLIVDGDLGSEVVFQGDRLESAYDMIPGQWGIQLDCPIETGVGSSVGSIIRGGLWFYESPGSTIEYAVLRNGNVGVQVDTTGVNYNSLNFSVDIRNTKILNMAGIGILGQGGSIRGKNVLVGNCGQSCAYFGLGGKYVMDNCTFANYWSDNSRTSPAFVLNNYYEDVNQNIQLRELVSCQFNNCIMFGNNAFLSDFNEFSLDIDDGIPSGFVFRYCLVDTDENVEDDGTRFLDMSNNQAPFLCDPVNMNYHISSGGLVMSGNQASANPLTEDIDGMSWGTQLWKGCYAFDASTPCE
jgi:hypothetical protein